MKQFLEKHQDDIAGVISFDRVVFKGNLPLGWAGSMANLLHRNGMLIKDFKKFVEVYSLIDPLFGLLHVRLPTWFPFPLQLCLNAHEFLARRNSQG